MKGKAYLKRRSLKEIGDRMDFGLFLWMIVLFVALFFLSGIKVLKEWERAPVLRLGRYVGMKGPGIIYVFPLIDRIPKVISTRIKTMTFKSEQTLTLDNVPVTVDAVMYFKPIDVELCVLNVEDYNKATYWAAQTTLREVIGRVHLQELLSHREKIGEELRKIIDEKTEAWGVKVLSVEIKDVVIPQALQDAMSRQAQAERERIARVTLANAEYEAASKMVEAAKLYEETPQAITLRWINVLSEISSKGNMVVIIPAQIPGAGIAPIGLLGLNKERKDEA